MRFFVADAGGRMIWLLFLFLYISQRTREYSARDPPHEIMQEKQRRRVFPHVWDVYKGGGGWLVMQGCF